MFVVLQRCGNRGLFGERSRHCAELFRHHLRNGQHIVVYRGLPVDEDGGRVHGHQDHGRGGGVELRILGPGRNLRVRGGVLPDFRQRKPAAVELDVPEGQRERDEDSRNATAADLEQGEGDAGLTFFSI